MPGSEPSQAVRSPEISGPDSRAPEHPLTWKHRLEYAAFRGATGAVTALPERASSALASALGRFGHEVLRIRREAVEDHLRLAFPDLSESHRREIAVGAYIHLSRETVQTLRLARWGHEGVRARTTVVGFEAVERAMAEGRGALMLTGHLGNWEVGAASMAARGIGTDVVAHRQTNPLYDRFWIDLREALGIRTLVKNDAYRLIPRSLEEGRMVALVADQNLRWRGVFVPFFGRLASTAKGPALFALRARVPIFLGVAFREPGWPPRYRVEIVEVPVPRDGGRKERMLELTRLHVRLLEDRIREAPEQYFWMHKRWKTRPADERPDGRAVDSERTDSTV